MCTCDFDGNLEFSSTTTPRARKPHRCDECPHVIQPAERYVKTVMKWEGDISTHESCMDCQAWTEELFKAQEYACGCSGVEHGGLWGAIAEFCQEHLGYDPGDEEDGRMAHAPEPYETPLQQVDRIRRARAGLGAVP